MSNNQILLQTKLVSEISGTYYVPSVRLRWDASQDAEHYGVAGYVNGEWVTANAFKKAFYVTVA